MKIRKGFVSNSSAASFIIGVAYTTNFEKVQEFLKKHPTIDDDGNFWCKPLLQLILSHDLSDDWSSIKKEGDTLIIESFTGETVSLDLSKIDKNSFVVAFDLYGDHDDSFYWDEDSGELDYDKLKLTDFSDQIQSLYNDLTKENGFQGISKSFGGGRNG